MREDKNVNSLTKFQVCTVLVRHYFQRYHNSRRLTYKRNKYYLAFAYSGTLPRSELALTRPNSQLQVMFKLP